uniref:Uncharacterized protein n=1 Tax=Nelumbo nucifera TaxID=4432 RepID=A0A822Z221_NELNU|nr:TPA_asm: hypothetical protein HUJ06_008372 [Nelumbo nucifera]
MTGKSPTRVLGVAARLKDLGDEYRQQRRAVDDEPNLRYEYRFGLQRSADKSPTCKLLFEALT